MDDQKIPEFIDNFDDDKLREELIKNGVSVGPITPTTRKLLKRRLAKRLGAVVKLAFMPSQGVKDVEPQPMQKTTEIEVKTSPISIATEQEKCDKIVAELAKSAGNVSSAASEYVEKKCQFYGILLPRKDLETDGNEPLVFRNQSNALRVIKGHKNARFRVFSTFEDAKNYSINGIEEPLVTAESNATESEDAGAKFPSLRQVDLNQMMRLIESGEIEKIRSLLWSNPKYIISSADGPVVLKPSTRYNALHIATKANQPEVCREILETLQNPDFQAMLFPNTYDEDVNNQRTEHLLDGYLNTPEKILYETPLHLACKMGYKDVVAELVTYSQCSTNALNKSGKTPGDITCSRASSKVHQEEIHQLLGEQYYVPLLRYEDNSEQAIVGTPITMNQRLSEFNPPESQDCDNSPLKSSVAVSALAGPMPKDVAVRFQKSWTTPSKCKGLARSVRYLRRADSEKGDEQIGRIIAEKEHVGWIEYWDFLSDFANFATEEGLTKLEVHLRDKITDFFLREPKESCSQDINQLANLFDKIHLGQSTEDARIQDFPQIDVKTNRKNSTYSAGPESIPHTDSIIRTPKTSLSKTQNKDDPNQRLSSGISVRLEDESELVKELFPDNMSENVMECSSSEPQNVEPSSSWRSHDVTTAYRPVGESSSELFSSTAQSDTSLGSSVSGHRQLIFLVGQAPTKLDRDVLLAIGDADIDFVKFPAILQWKFSVLSFSEDDRQKWATPRREQSYPFNLDRNDSVANGHAPPFSPAPSSGPRRFLTPNNSTMRRLLYKPFTPPCGR